MHKMHPDPLNSATNLTKYIAFLRGINVGGHHKVPMADLRLMMEKMGYRNATTILNSGNVIFEAQNGSQELHQTRLTDSLQQTFGFPIPVLLRSEDQLRNLINNNPFKNRDLTKNLRFYVSFLNNDVNSGFSLPWTGKDGSFSILEKIGKTVFSILDVAVSNTPQGMKALEGFYGKDITTRNWNTIKRIHSKL